MPTGINADWMMAAIATGTIVGNGAYKSGDPGYYREYGSARAIATTIAPVFAKAMRMATATGRAGAADLWLRGDNRASIIEDSPPRAGIV